MIHKTLSRAARSMNIPSVNVLLFSFFWALQIFTFKLSLNAGIRALPLQIVALLVALVFIWCLSAVKTGREFVYLVSRQPLVFWELFIANALQAGFGTSLSIIGIALTETINAGFLVKLATVSTTLFAWWMLGEKVTWRKSLLLLSMLAGAYLLTTKGQNLYPRTGDLFILGACVFWSLGNVLVRKVLRARPVSADVVTLQKPLAGLMVFLVLLTLTVLTPGIFGGLIEYLDLQPLTLPQFLYSLAGGVCLAATWYYLNRTLKVASASYMTMMSMSTPVFVTLLAMVFLGEVMLPIQALGAGMILLAGVATYFSDIAEQ